MPPKKRKISGVSTTASSSKTSSGNDDVDFAGKKRTLDPDPDIGAGTVMAMKQRDTIHPLLLPNVVPVILNHLHSEDILHARLVCKLWNEKARKKTCVFLNSKVFSHLVQYLSWDTLLKFRLVCSLWNTIILKSPRWNNISQFMEEKSWTSFFSSRVGSSDMARFLDKFGDPDSLLLSSAFSHFYAPNNISLNDEMTQKFCTRYGRFFKALTMQRCKWELKDLRDILFQHCRKLRFLRIVCGIIPGTQAVGRGKNKVIPELETLLHEDPGNVPVLESLRCIELDMNMLDTQDQPRPYLKQFLIELFESCPNLESLNIDVSSWYARAWVTNFVCTCEQIGLKQLKMLKHLIDPDQCQIINLRLKQFPLSTLRIRLRYRDVTLKALHELLSSLKHTLINLQIIFLEYTCAHDFPSSKDLCRLKRLELWKFKGQLDFLKDFPVLEELLIGEMELKGQALFNQRDVFQLLLPNL